MAFVKIVKNKAYSMRMQVKPKRRRQGKTDYYARRRLTCQDKNKYESRKYRLVVRRTNTRILAQVIFSTMTGDKVLCSANSIELKRFGLTAGLTNYSAAYATGLLIARRLLKQVGLQDLYKQSDDVSGDYYNVEDAADDDKKPFKCYLDVGICRTTTGARLFGVLKGACDGGINIPHATKRFPGYKKARLEAITNKRGKAVDTEKTEASFDPAKHRDRIFGGHVTSYMNKLKKENSDKFKRHFSQWQKCLDSNKAKTCEEVYKKVHKAICANPDRVSDKKNAKPVRNVVTAGCALVQQDSKGRKWLRQHRLTRDMRKQRVMDKFNAAMQNSQ